MRFVPTIITIVAISSLCGCTSSKTQQVKGNLSISLLTATEMDLRAPGRGAEQWHDQNAVDIRYLNDSLNYGADKYYRFSWTQLEKAEGEYDWTMFDQEIQDAIEHNQLFSFGIMPTCPSCTDDGKSIRLEGKIASYPAYLHKAMQLETSKDWVSPLSDMWVPNWNSPAYLKALKNLCEAVNKHLQNSQYKNRKFKDVIRYIDLRGYGSYGEWHQAFIVQSMDDHPEGTRATESTLARIVDIHLNAFQDYRLVTLLGSLDAGLLGNTKVPAAIGYQILNAETKAGPLGIRRDNWGATDTYIKNYLEHHPVRFKDLSFQEAIRERWKTAPMVGEPIHNDATSNGCAMGDLENQVRRYHASSFGNGNFENPLDPCLQKNIRAAAIASGYRLQLEGGQLDSLWSVGDSISIQLHWRNAGVAPLYEKRELFLQLHRLQDDSLCWETKSQFNPRLFLPMEEATVITDQIKIPVELPAGNYSLRVSLRDPTGYLPPLPLANLGRQADGSYFLYRIEILKKQ